MTPLHRILRLTALGLLAGAGQGYCLAASIRLPAAHAGTRYASATYGYSLLLPVGWVRVPNVHWTPLGPRADLTMMPPDHQAALSRLVHIEMSVSAEAQVHQITANGVGGEDTGHAGA